MLGYCTIAARNYLAHVRVLARSLTSHNPGTELAALIIDDVDDELTDENEPFTILRPHDLLSLDSFERMAAIYDVTELSTAVKPWLLRHLLDRDGHAGAVYLDPDIEVFSSLGELEGLVRDHGLVLTPHVTAPMPRDGLTPSETDILVAGVWNLGFIAVAAGSAAESLLDFWEERLEADCRIEPASGYFVDQRWMDFAPGIVPSMFRLRDAGYNVAYWNLPERDVTSNGGGYTVNGRPLRFFHFSGYDPDRPSELSRHQTRVRLASEPTVRELCDRYRQRLEDEGRRQAGEASYGYGTLADGTPINAVMRQLIAEGLEEGALPGAPFGMEETGRLLRWLNEPHGPGGRYGVTRFLAAVHASRADLRQAYPDLAVAGPEYLAWIRRWGHQVPMVDSLTPHEDTSEDPAESARTEVVPHPLWGVNVAGYLRSELGIGEAARQVISSLDAVDMPVYPIGYGNPLSRSGTRFGHSPVPSFPHPVTLLCVNADTTPFTYADIGERTMSEHYNIGLWFWEVSTFPERMASSFDLVDEVWVATEHVAEALRPHATKPVVKVTLPIVPATEARLARDQLGMPPGFVFLFSWDYHSVFARKNPLGTIDAFSRAFPPGSGPSLVLKSINGDHHVEEHERVLRAAAEHPDIHVIDRYVSLEEKNAMMASCDCYLSLHRAEGLGLTLGEAMYFGRPVIGTAYSGPLEFMTPENSYLVDYTLTPIGPGSDPYPPTGTWAEPDYDQAAAYMQQVVGQPEAAGGVGQRAAADIRRTHSRHAAGRSLLERLECLRVQFPILADRRRRPRPDTRTVISAGPPEAPGMSPPKRAPRSMLIRAGRARAAHQWDVDNSIMDEIDALTTRLTELEAEVRDTQRTDGAVLRTVRALEREERETSADVDAALADLRETRVAAGALPFLAGDPFHTQRHAVAGNVLGYEDGTQSLDPYRAFEDVFRGSEEFIRSRQRVFVELLEGAGPVVDIGCGRGELLDLLREFGAEYSGVDLDPGMVARCREKGHEAVVEGDALEYLERQPDDSLGAVLAIQVIEHLPHEELEALLVSVRRVLHPGGLLIAETVNPHSPPALKTFWVDPTHQHPIFPEAALVLARSAGFPKAFVFHPNGVGDAERDRFTTGEYALVATAA